MDQSLISGFVGLAGVAIGGLTSFSTTWLTQQAQLRQKHRELEWTKCEEIFAAFIAEASRLYGDALSHEKDDVTDLVQLYALVARMRLLTSREVVAAAEAAMDSIIETYLAPNLTLHELRGLAKTGGMNFLQEFGEVCRTELGGSPLRSGQRVIADRPAGSGSSGGRVLVDRHQT